MIYLANYLPIYQQLVRFPKFGCITNLADMHRLSNDIRSAHLNSVFRIFFEISSFFPRTVGIIVFLEHTIDDDPNRNNWREWVFSTIW